MNRLQARAGVAALWLSLATGCMTSASTPPWTVARPEIHVGDRWVYSFRTERPTGRSGDSTVQDKAIAVTPDSMTIRRITVGAGNAPVETVYQRDWTRLRSINGVQTTIARDLAFPLAPGKTWSNEYLDTKPGNPGVTLRRTYRYRVIARETIEVAAGHFDAIRIETDGGWHPESNAASPVATPDPDSPDTASLHFVSWYAPAIGRFVRFEEDVRLPSGTTFSHTVIELRSVTPAPRP